MYEAEDRVRDVRECHFDASQESHFGCLSMLILLVIEYSVGNSLVDVDVDVMFSAQSREYCLLARRGM